MNLYKNSSSNIKKTWLLMASFFVLVILLGWFLSYYFQNPAILYIAFFFSLGMNFFSYWSSDKIVLKMAGAREAHRQEYFDLYTTVENLAITAGLPMPKVYLIEDPAPNAFATGRNKEHAVIVVTTGLLQILEKPELEGVVAHELAHIGNRDILLQTVVVTLVGLVTLVADFFLRSSFLGGRDSREGSSNHYLMILGLILIILSPIIASLIQLAISRKREFLADSTGALLTRYPEGLASALEKISQFDGTLKRANSATAHLYISSPFAQKKSHFWQKMFLTHPPVEERIRLLRES